MAKALPPYDVLRQLLSYDPEAGDLTWKSRPLDMFNGDVRICGTWNTRYAGKPALHAKDTTHGYRVGSILGTNYLAHRIAWSLFWGSDPIGEVDHINGDRADNSMGNLRDVDKKTNQRNAGQRKDNQSGTTGVHWHKASGKWCAAICNKSLGVFNSRQDAVEARLYAQETAGFHKNHGRKRAA